jgi:carboxyl-terminal processing protease
MRSRFFVIVAIFATALVTGGWLVERGLTGAAFGHGTSVSGSSRRSSGNRARLFENVFDHVARYYVDSLGERELFNKSVDGMLSELHDPHSVYLRPERLARFSEATTGNYGGVGIQIDVRDGWITVIAPLPGTPAAQAGVLTGDRVIEVSGKTTRGWTSDEALKALRGVPGTKVSITIERPGLPEHIPLTLVRTDIHRSAVRRPMMLDRGVGYVGLDVFSDSTARELRRAIDSLQRAGLVSLILDLRNNPGGLLSQGVGVSDIFLEPGQRIVSMRGRTSDANRDFLDDTKQLWPEMPLVVLINEGSASASEIVAGALQDHDRAIVVGRQSFGKGSAQSLFNTSGGGALKLTTARWFTPSGRSIDKPQRARDSDSDEDTVQAKPKRAAYKTDVGRVVYGGGGIHPDVFAGDTAVPPEELAFAQALKEKVPLFQDALTDYALALKTSKGVDAPNFVVTPAMREEVWRRMRTRGISIDRAIYDKAEPMVSRLLGYQIARYSFGTSAENKRAVLDDKVVRTAMGLLFEVTNRKQLMDRAAARRTAPPDSE